MLHLCLQRALPEGRLHQDLRPKLEARCQHWAWNSKIKWSLHGIHRSVDDRPQRSPRKSRGQREQRLHQTQVGDGDPQRREASKGSEDSPEQEDGALLRTGAGGHHRGHQAGLWSSKEALHAGRETGLITFGVPVLFFDTNIEKTAT